MTEEFKIGEEVLVRGTVTALASVGDRKDLVVATPTGTISVDPAFAYKVTTGDNSFWTERDHKQAIDGQCGGCGFVGKVSVHKLCAPCGWWSRREQWQKNDFHPIGTLVDDVAPCDGSCVDHGYSWRERINGFFERLGWR
jgi:hypothetical protein